MTKETDHKSSQFNGEITLFLSGDVMTGRGIDQAFSYSVDPTLHESNVSDAKDYLKLAERHSGDIPNPITFEYLWGDALGVFQKFDPDVRIVNLETAVTLSDYFDDNKRIHYRMHPKNVSLLSVANIDVCVLANNHTLDWGHKGLQETLEVLKKHNIKTAGAGLNAGKAAAPSVINTDNRRLLVFSYATSDSGIQNSWRASENPGINLLQSLEPEESLKVIKHIKHFREDGDRVIFSIHWGSNWGYEVPASQQSFSHALLDTGVVDLIHGHSSHHPKPIEVYKKRLILYGCGDLINDYEGISGDEQYRDDLSLLYLPRLTASGSLASLTMIPMQMRKFRLNHPNEADKKWLKEQLNYVCEQFGTSMEATDSDYFKLYW